MLILINIFLLLGDFAYITVKNVRQYFELKSQKFSYFCKQKHFLMFANKEILKNHSKYKNYCNHWVVYMIAPEEYPVQVWNMLNK
jgi:hypothetical protein